MVVCAEYVWLDGTEGMPQLRSKTKVVDENASELPMWGFDGGSTNQGTLEDSDRVLVPVRSYKDPFRGEQGFIVLCEVCDVKKNKIVPHSTNHRKKLDEKYAEVWNKAEPWFGFEQEYTLMNLSNGEPIAWFGENPPKPQGDYYCGIGAENAIGRNLAEEHLNRCLFAGVELAGINAEVMAGQWEFQTNATDPLKASDDLWVARYILGRVAERHGIGISYHPKPKEDWNGAGCHTNFSSEAMREGYDAIVDAIECLGESHKDIISVCGEGTNKRLTGECETSSHKKFTHGVSDRGASVRIPWQVQKEKKGYLEDRRPSANIDPYKVCYVMMESILGEEG